MKEFLKFNICFEETELDWKFPLQMFDSIEQYYSAICDNWEKIISDEIPPAYQAILAYLFVIYHDQNRISQLYEKVKTLEVACYYIMFLTRAAQLEEVNKIIEQYSLDCKNRNKCFFIRVDFLLWQAYFFMYNNEFEKAETLIQQANSLIEEEKAEHQKEAIIQQRAFYFFIAGLAKERQRLPLEAIDDYVKGIGLLEDNKIEDEYMLATLYNSFANAQWFLGNSEARTAYEKAFEKFEKCKIERGMIICQANLSSMLVQAGKFDEALSRALKIIFYLEKSKDKRNLLVVYNTIYLCLRSLGKIGEAEIYLNRALKLMEETSLEYDEIYLDASEFYAIKGDIDSSKRFLQKYSDLFKGIEEEKSIRKTQLMIAEGYIELKKNNFYKAEKLFRAGIAIAKEINVIPLLIQGFFYLIELLIINLRLVEKTTKLKIVHELELICQETVALLRSYNSIFQLVNYNLLLSQIYVLTNKLDPARDLLERTYKICLENNYPTKRIKENIERIKALKENTKVLTLDNLLVDYDFSTSMIEISEKGIQEATLLIKPQTRPKLLFLQVVLPNGLPIYNYNFSKEENFTEDEVLLAGLVNAIENFSSEFSNRSNGFRALEHSEYYILLEERNKYSFALFAKQFSYDLKKKIQEFSEQGLKFIRLAEERGISVIESVKLKNNLDKLVESILLSN
ncbi:MAG: hypothetical protein ACTSQE_14135 [Candidatus Heimdallarchaeaceae archaeon]